MGKKSKINNDDLAVFLEEKAIPVPNAVIAKVFDCLPKTVSKHAREAREKDGYPILPTSEGQWYVKAITTPEQYTLILSVAHWSAKSAAHMRKLNGVAQGQITALPPRRIERLDREAKQASGE